MTNGTEAHRRLTPERVRTTTFSRPPFGRRGYHEDEVRMFLARVADDIQQADAEKSQLRAEIARLVNYYRERGESLDADGRPTNGGGPSIDAVNLLSRAQQAADSQMAQAEEYARQLVQQARERYSELLQHAQQQAQQAAEEAAQASEQLGSFGGTEVERRALEQKIAYLRTFAEVTEVQLRSVLEALTREVNKLGDVSHIS